MNKNCTCLVVWISIIVLITHIMNEKRVLGLDELFTKMKTYEHQIQRMILQNLQLIQANYTRTSQSQSHSFKGNSYPSPKTFPEPNNTSLGSNTYSKPKTTNFSQIQCQIYKRFCHNSSQCYFLYFESKNSGQGSNTSRPQLANLGKDHLEHLSQVQD